MGFHRGIQTKNKYNKIFEEAGIRLRINEWSSSFVSLSTGFALTSHSEIRKFRSRLSNPNLLQLYDSVYTHSDADIRDEMIKNVQRENARVKNKKYWKNLDHETKQQKIKHMQQIQQLVDRSAIVRPEPWNKGLTKHDERIQKISKQRSGKGNPMYGTTYTQSQRLEKSTEVKKRILNGKFTPNSNNRNTHWDSQYKGKKYRSSWEAMYVYWEPESEYEKLRIPYMHENKEYVYIVDFINKRNSEVVEVKPKSQCNFPQFKAKMKAVKQWCAVHEYTYVLVDEDYFLQVGKPRDLTEFDNNTQTKIEKFYETYQPNKNKKT